ncbi:MAG: hypothetical protein WCT04_09060 [Planctomycetota bacterium]
MNPVACWRFLYNALLFFILGLNVGVVNGQSINADKIKYVLALLVVIGCVVEMRIRKKEQPQ